VKEEEAAAAAPPKPEDPWAWLSKPMPKHKWQTTLADAMLRDRVRLAPVEHASPPLCFAYAVWKGSERTMG
jgi:hypothetical protein